MKSVKSILQSFLFLVVILIAAKTEAFAKKPFVIKLVEKPAVLHVGQTHTFAFEVQNVSSTPLTLSSRCAASAGLSWSNKDGTGGGTGSGCGSTIASVSIATRYDSETGKFECVTTTLPNLPYDKDDFFTLQSNETKRFETEATVSDNLKPRFVTVTISYESQYDGSAVGVQA